MNKEKRFRWTVSFTGVKGLKRLYFPLSAWPTKQRLVNDSGLKPEQHTHIVCQTLGLVGHSEPGQIPEPQLAFHGFICAHNKRPWGGRESKSLDCKKENLITTKLQTERGRGGGLSEAPSSGRFPSCSLKRGTLGRGWGADGGCTWGMSSPSLRLASMSCSLDRLGPVHRSDYQLTHSDGERREKLRLETEKSANKLKEEKKDENGRKTPTGRKENW